MSRLVGTRIVMTMNIETTSRSSYAGTGLWDYYQRDCKHPLAARPFEPVVVRHDRMSGLVGTRIVMVMNIETTSRSSYTGTGLWDYYQRDCKHPLAARPFMSTRNSHPAVCFQSSRRLEFGPIRVYLSQGGILQSQLPSSPLPRRSGVQC